MIKAGSMAYAIFICVLVSIFCYTLVMMSSFSKFHQSMLFTYTELIATNESAQYYFLNNIEEVNQSNSTLDLFDNGIQSNAIVKPWGFYEILVTKSIFKKDTLLQTVLIGEKQKSNNLALYLTDTNKGLFMVDKASIKGNAKLPAKGIKSGYITTNAYKNNTFLSGDQSLSKTKLPEINNRIFEYYDHFKDSDHYQIPLDALNDTVYRSFDKPTLEVLVNTINIKQKKLTGNIVLVSKDSIHIKNNNSFENIIIKAPKVVFEKGFRGNVQVESDQLITLEENVILEYPSGILIHKGKEAQKEVNLKKGSKVLGAVVLTDDDPYKSINKLIKIHEGAEVIGDVFCSGKIELQGVVIGTVYTNAFILQTQASIYDNYIMNGTIDRKSLPDTFIRIPLLKSTTQNKKYEIITPI